MRIVEPKLNAERRNAILDTLSPEMKQTVVAFTRLSLEQQKTASDVKEVILVGE